MCLAFLIFLFCGPLYAGGPDISRPAKPVELIVWAMGAEGKLIRIMADRFEKDNPGIKVITQAIPWNGAHEKLITAVVGNIPPDICQMGTTWMSEFHAMNALLPLEGYLAKPGEDQSKKIAVSDFFDGCKVSITFGEHILGIPWYVDTRLFYYRTDLANQAGYPAFPKNWDELIDLCRKIKTLKSEKKMDGYSITLPVNDWQIFLIFLWQNKGEIINNTMTRASVNTPAVSEAIEFMMKFFAEGLSPLEAARDMDILNAFETGFFPMFISGPWMISEIERTKPNLTGKWMSAPMPAGKDKTSFIGGSNLVIFKNSPNKDAAWRFVEYVNRVENQVEWYSMSKNLPSRKDAWDRPLLKDNQYLAAFRQQLQNTQAPPALPEWELIASILSEALEQIVYKKTTITAGLENCENRINSILARNTTQQTTVFKISVTVIISLIIIGVIFFYLIRKSGAPGLSKRAKYNAAAYIFLVPALGVLTVFLFIPIVATFILSLTNWNIYAVNDISKVIFVGLENYTKLFTDPVFWISLKNTMIFSLVGVPLNIALALLTAVILNQQFIRFKPLFRIGFFIPVVTTMVAVAVVWRWLYNPEFGIFNYFLGLVGIAPLNWLSDTALVLPSLILMAVWKGFGYNMIIFIAALQSIPECLYEAADLDGATDTQQFFYITLPMLKKTTFFIIIMTTIGYLQFFAEPYIMTQGGPLNSSMSVVLYMYNNGFKYYNLGYASAIAYILFGIIFAFTYVQFAFSQKMED